MSRANVKSCSRPAVTLMELVIAMAMIGIIFAAILPQFALIRNSWDVKQGTAEALQNGRVLMDHINRNLSKAVRITAVSEFSDTEGHIEYEDNDGNIMKYDYVASGNYYVKFGPLDNLEDLAGPVSSLTFTCYDACDLDLDMYLSPVTDTNDIRVIKVDATFTNSGSLGQNKTFTTWVYLRVNSQSEECWSDEDIGAVAATGSATFADCNWTVVGSGVDIWDNTDGFHYVYQSLNGDGQIVARVVSMTNTDPWAKAGVMIRETLTGGSKHAMMVVTPESGNAFQRRLSTDGVSDHTAGNVVTAPYWVKLTRRGNTLTGYESPNGSTWTQVGSDTVTMSSGVYIGLAVTSHNDGVLCTANFDNVSFLTYDAFTEAKVSTDSTSITIPTPGDAGAVSILGSWVESTIHAKEPGVNRALVFLVHTRGSSATANVASYGGQTMTKVVEQIGGTAASNRAYVAAYILNEAGVNAASSDTFGITWSGTAPASVAYSSVFLQNVNQTTLTGATGSNTGTTATVSTSSSLPTSNGGMVINAAACLSAGAYTVNNDFTETLELSVPSGDGVDGYKFATGASETPSVTHAAAARQSLVGFVVNCSEAVASIEGDLLIAAVATDGDTSGSIIAPVGQGWTLINRGAYNSEVTLGAWWKNAGASEPASHTFTWTASGNQQAYGWMMRFAGHNPAPANPINTSLASGQTSSTPTSPAVTTTVDGCLILRLGAFDDGYITLDAPGLSGHSPITMDSAGTVEILGSWATGTTHAKETGTSRALVFVAHAEGNTSGSTPSLTSVTYGGQAMTKVVEIVNSSGATRTYTVAFILNDAGINAATTTTFSPTWGTAATSSTFAHVFLQNVDQTTPTGATASNQTSTGATITTAELANNAGDRVIEAGTCSNTGTYTPNNGFTEALEVAVTNADGCGGYKLATGAAETPSVTHSRTTERQTLIGFVVQGAGRVSGGAGYVRQATAGSSDTSTFSLSASNEAQMLTIAIAPDGSKGEVCCDGGLRP